MNTLISLLIFSLPFGVLLRTQIIPNVYVNAPDLIVVAIFMVTIYSSFKKIKSIKLKHLLGPLLGFVAVGVISLVFHIPTLESGEVLSAFLYLLRFVIYVGIIFAIQFLDKKSITSLPQKMMISGGFFVIFGFIQYFFYPSLRNLFYAGWDEHLYRLFSTFLDPNFAGVFIALVSLLTLSFILALKDKKHIYVYYVLFLFSVIAMYLTYSRSALLAFIIGVIFVFIKSNKTKYILPGVLVVFVGVFIFSDFKVEGLNPFRIASSEARLKSASEAFYIISKEPILGVGFNAYRAAQIEYGTRKGVTEFPSASDASTDNSFLFVFATTGVIGLLFYLIFIFRIGSTLYRGKVNDAFSLAAFPSFVALIVASQFLNVLFYPLIISWVFILIGVMVSRKQ